MDERLVERFRARVEIVDTDDCIFWPGYIQADCGYGTVCAGREQQRAHRVAFFIANGSIPKGMRVCHSCDVRWPPGDITYRACCNPRHLWLGTDLDNSRDARAKGRHAHGGRSSSAVLTEDKVREIHRRFGQGELKSKLMAEFGIQATAIRNIARGKTWSHLALGAVKSGYARGHYPRVLGRKLNCTNTLRGERHRSAKLTELLVREIHQALLVGAWPSDLADQYGVTVRQIRAIGDGKKWKHLGLSPVPKRKPGTHRRRHASAAYGKSVSIAAPRPQVG